MTLPIAPATAIDTLKNLTLNSGGLEPSHLVDNQLNTSAIEKQLIKFSATPDGGSLVLRFNGVNASGVLFSALNAANVQTALRALALLGSIVVSGSVAAGFLVQFIGYAGNPPTLSAPSSTLTTDGLTATPVVVTVTEENKGR